MQTKTKGNVVLCLLLAACGPSVPVDPANAVTPLTLEPPPIYALLGYRADLDLQSGQIARLDSLANWIRDENAPLVDSLRVVSGQAEQNRRGFVVDEANEALLEEIRANNRRAGEAVGEVLTEEQQASVCRLYDRPRRGDPPRSRGRPGGDEEEAADTVTTRSGRLWPWCGPASAAEDSASAGRG